VALATYADLQTAVAEWIHRTDLTARIPDFIALAESTINSKLIVRTAEAEAALTLTLNVSTAPLPSDYVSPIVLWLDDGSGRCELGNRLPQTLPRPENQASTRPELWAVEGANVRFDCPVDQLYTVTLRYVQKFALSDSATTNWLLTNHPNVYLYGALCESAPYTVSDNRLPTWKALFEEAIAMVNAKEARSRESTLTVDPGIMPERGYGRILRGE